MDASVEGFFVAVALAVAVYALVAATRGAHGVRIAALSSALLVTGVSFALLRPRAPDPPPPSRPRVNESSTYVSSAACRSCHPAEHASFGRTFHRTMTQDATPRTVLAPLDGRALVDRGRAHALVRRGEAIFATLPDPDRVAEEALAAARGEPTAGAPAPDVERRVVVTTGSHREQAFWVAGARPGELRLFPWVWLVRERAFVPRRDAFLAPPDAPMPPVRWNSNCIACHAVAGEPGHDPSRDAFDTKVAELGVACEACHGPGGEHAARHRDPLTRWSARGGDDRTIVHPDKLPPERSAAVCGQCHAYSFPRDEAAWWSAGYARTFRPGDALEPTRVVLDAATLREGGGPRLDAAPASLFWGDGSIRVGGREYNGLVRSACYARGEGGRKATCTSCHAMHRGDPEGQIAPERAGDGACTTCHTGHRGEGHAHHAAGSPGSACVACHMPRTSYALFTAVRSHTIDSPSVAVTLASGRPNACNLCHLDRTLGWTARWLAEWYGAPRTELAGDRATVAAGVRDALAGDAAVRVVVADALGSKEAIAASGSDYQAAVLAELLVDPYAAVRFVAGRSIRALPGYEAFPYDFRASPEARALAREEALRRFARRSEERAVRRGPAGLASLALEPSGALDARRVSAVLAERDDRAVTIAE